MRYKIFGKKVKFNIWDDDIVQILAKELSLYPQIEDKNIDIEINFVSSFTNTTTFLNNPSIHYTFEKGFIADFGSLKVKYMMNEETLNIEIIPRKHQNYISKFRSIDYRNSIESITTTIHELVLVPMMFFVQDYAPVHASSLKCKKNGKVILIGGSGGVGKTSLELLLGRELGYSFISDDIAYISRNNVYPNLSFPKIYAYNVVNNIKFEKELFSERGFLDKFQWLVRKKLRGLNRVRRSVSPKVLFDSFEKNNNKVDEYYMLFKTNLVESIKMEQLSSSDCAILTLNIIKNEYSAVLKHIVWHEMNTRLLGVDPIIKESALYKKWLEIYNDIFSRIQCHKVMIPPKIDHNKFLKIMKSIIDD